MISLLLINQIQYKPADEDTDGRTLGQYDPKVWRGVRMMLLGFALLLVVASLYYLGGWF